MCVVKRDDAGTALEFSMEIVNQLFGNDAAKKVGGPMSLGFEIGSTTFVSKDDK